MARATFGAGCFWYPQHFYDQIPGVTETQVGYMGGTKPQPTYEEVCHTPTGHAEVIQVDYDPTLVSYDELLELFWRMHDPAQIDGQGDDAGSQCRSVIFVHEDSQAAAARTSKEAEAASGRHDGPITTTLLPAQKFWVAEDYHQKYFARLDRPSVFALLSEKLSDWLARRKSS